MIMLLKTDLKLMIMKIDFDTGDHDNQSNLSVNNNEAEDVEGKGRKVNLQNPNYFQTFPSDISSE